MKTIRRILFVLLILTLGLTTSCKKKNETGQVETKLTDDPFPMSFIASVNMDISKVEIKNDENDQWVTLYEGNASYDIASLNNGASASVSVQNVPAGTYDKIRLTIDGVSVELTDGRIFQVNINGSLEAESDIEPALQVDGGGDAQLLIDVDLAESFEFENNASGIITNVAQILGISSFDLDFRAVDANQTGTVTGTVQDPMGNVYANATVKLHTQSDLDGDGDIDDITTITNAQGEFTLLGVPAGTYIIEVETENDVDLISNTFTVSAGGNVQVNSFTVN